MFSLDRGKTISKVISVSKIKKIIVSIKNRREKDLRFSWFGSKPHSNGENFSIEGWVVFIKLERIKNTLVRSLQTIILFQPILVSLDFLIGN